jgi:hypothetical protein
MMAGSYRSESIAATEDQVQVETIPPNLLLSMFGCSVGLGSRKQFGRPQATDPKPSTVSCRGFIAFPGGEGDESQDRYHVMDERLNAS